MRASQVRATATGVGPKGRATAARQPSNHIADERASNPHAAAMCFFQLFST